MNDSKIFQVLSAFSKEELKEFGYFVHSPYYNRVKSVTDLFDTVKPYYPDFTARTFTKEAIYKKLFGNAKYNDAVMRNLLSDLYRLAGEFTAVKGFERKEELMKLNELTGMKKYLGEKALQNELLKLQQKFETRTNRDGEYYFELFRFWNGRNNTFEAKDVDQFHGFIDKEIETLSQFYIIHMFDRFFQANRLRTSYKTKSKHNFLEDVSAVLKKYGFMEDASVKIHYTVYMLTMTMDENYYFELKELLRESGGILNSYTRFVVFQSLSVFFMNMMRQGKSSFNRDRFEMYRDAAVSGDMIYNNDLSDAVYTSAVVAALNVGEFDWAETFNEEYRLMLKENIRQDAYYYNKARILHARGANDEALKYLARVISTHHPIKAVVKVIELQILYELDSRESIELKLDSLRHWFMKNEDMNETMRESLKSFHRIYSMLVELREGSSKRTAREIKKYAESKKQSYSMEWLKEKINEQLATKDKN